MSTIHTNPLVSTGAPLKIKPVLVKSEDLAPKDNVALDNRPHADFETNLAKLLHRKLSLEGQPSQPNPDFNEPISNQDVDQTGFQQALTAELSDDLTRIQYAQDGSKLNWYIPTTTQLQDEFNKLAADPSVPFEYITDGCYARAHVMCDTMNGDHMNNGKIFCMVENPYDKQSRLEAHNKYIDASWWYHVAPLVYAKEDSGNVKPFVMDPSMANHPLRPEEWIHMMWDEQDKIKVDVTRDPQYGPLESDGLNATFEESMPSARQTMAEYSIEMAKIKEDYAHDHPDQPTGKKAA